MAKKPETNFKERVLTELNDRYKGAGYFEKISQVAVRGTPDILGCLKRHSIVIELKTDEGSTDPLQAYKLTKWREAGAVVIVMTPQSFAKDLAMLDILAR